VIRGLRGQVERVESWTVREEVEDGRGAELVGMEGEDEREDERDVGERE
jgi:hypothetical protein